MNAVVAAVIPPLPPPPPPFVLTREMMQVILKPENHTKDSNWTFVWSNEMTFRVGVTWVEAELDRAIRLPPGTMIITTEDIVKTLGVERKQPATMDVSS